MIILNRIILVIAIALLSLFLGPYIQDQGPVQD